MKMEIKEKDIVDYFYPNASPLRCIVKRFIEYNNRIYVILEPENQPIKSEIMVPEDQVGSSILKVKSS
jgi:hypothetical protein